MAPPHAALSAALLCAAAVAPQAAGASGAVPLRNAAVPGVEMPVVGLGTGGYGVACADGSAGPCPAADCAGARPEIWTSAGCPGTARDATKQWLSAGGERIDAAANYMNQDAIGKGIKDAGVPRDRFFITSKVGGDPMPMGYNETLQTVDRTLSDLGVEYVDLLLLHWPWSHQPTSDPACITGARTHNATECRLQGWRALQTLLASGKARALGVSNFNVTHLQEIADAGLPLPAVNQCPINPHLHGTQADVLRWCESHGVVFNGYSPFGVPDVAFGTGAPLFVEPAVAAAAAAHNRSAAEVLLSWQLAQGWVTNPRTRDAAHMRENLRAAADPVPLSGAESAAIGRIAQFDCSADLWYECEGTHGCNGMDNIPAMAGACGDA